VLPDAKFMTIKQFCIRRNCTPQTADRAIENDPDFPKVYLFGRLRHLEVTDVEKYDEVCRQRAADKAAAKAAAKAAKLAAKALAQANSAD
jgi:hypothetical protein